MKWAGYILAFYLIVLSAVPCCALDNCPDENTDLPTHADETANHESRDEDCGSCSPFFNCAGCATATIACQTVQFELSPLQISPVYATYLQVLLPQGESDFWQPPRAYL